MAIIQSGNSANQLIIEGEGQARVMLYGPDGEPLVSFLRGTGVDLDTGNGSEIVDVLAIGVPGPGGAQVAGTADTPLVVTGSLTVASGTLNVGNLPAVQNVAGTVAVSNLPTTQPVSGTVTVANQPTSLTVSNFPATQQVAGTVSVSNFPATQPVSGTVTVSNPTSSVAVSNLPTTQQVAGTVGVSNFPATQPVSGTVAVSNQPTSLSVSNFPTTQGVSGNVGADLRVGGSAVAAANRVPADVTGSVSVSNLPSTTTVAGTVAVSNQPTSLSVSNFPASQTVAGTVAVSNHPTTISVNNFPATQAVSGNLGADLRVAGAAVASGNRLPVDTTGTVTVSNLPTTQQVAGTVSVSNLPATQAVSGNLGSDLRVGGSAVTSGNRVPVDTTGTVTVSNLPATQQVAGTVTVSNQPTSLSVSNFPATQQVAGSVSVSNLPSTQQVAGSVNVGNFPATQAISGTVAAALQVNGAGATTTNPVPVVVTEPTDAAAEFVAVIDVMPAAALVDGATLWAIRNAGTKTIGCRRFDLQQGFVGTAAASRSAYVLQRFTGTVTGGTTVAPAKKVSTSAASTASILQATAALVVTAATFDAGPIHKQGSANQLAATTTQDVTFSGGPLILAPNEGLAIRASGAVVLGSFLTGSLGWYEL